MKTLKQIREASGGKEAYMKFFNSLLKKFGVDSPSELDGKKKKDFFNAVDKGWDGDGEKAEATIHISNELTEKLKAGKGSLKGKDAVGADVDWDNVGDEKKWIKQAKSKYKVIIKKDVGKYHSGMNISGKKADIIKFLQGPMYGGVDDRDIEEMWPWLLENKDDFKDDTDVSDDKGNYSGVEEDHEDDESPKKKVGDDEGNYSGVEEEAPPGMEDVVLKLKADGKTDEEAFAIAWSIYKKEKQRKGEYYNEAKRYPVMNAGQRVKIIKIAKKNSGNMQKAIKLIDKLKKGMSDNPDVMDILRKANEDLDLQGTGDTGSSKSVEETVDVDRRTLGFKAAMIRSEKAKKVREKAKLKKEKKKEQEVLDARYDYDGEVNTVLAAANKKLFGETGANSVSAGGIDMAPNAGKKKKPFKVVKRANY